MPGVRGRCAVRSVEGTGRQADCLWSWPAICTSLSCRARPSFGAGHLLPSRPQRSHPTLQHPRPTPLNQGLNNRCKTELSVVGEQYPFEPLQYLPKTLRLTFAEGIQMLHDAGFEVSRQRGWEPWQHLAALRRDANTWHRWVD